MRYAKLGTLGMFAATLWGGTALAQQLSTPQALENTYVSNPARPAVSDLTLTLQGGYESNVAESDAALAAARGIKQGDWVFTPSVSMNIVIPRGLTTFFAGGSAGYQLYSENHQFNQLIIGVNAGASTRFICEDTLVGDFEDGRRNDVISTGSGVVNSAATGGVRLSAACGQQYGLAPSVSVGERFATNSVELFKANDYRMFVAGGELAYRRPLIGSLGVYGEFDDLTYLQEQNVAGFLRHNGFKDYTGGVRFTHTGSALYLNASIGYNDLRPDMNTEPGYQGISYALDVRYGMGPRLSVRAGLTRAAVPSDLPYASYSVDSTYHAGVDYAVSDRLRLGIGGQIDYDQYRGTPFVFGLVVGNQTVYEGDAHADFRVSRLLDFGFSLRQIHRDTPTPGFSYDETVASASINAKFGN